MQQATVDRGLLCWLLGCLGLVSHGPEAKNDEDRDPAGESGRTWQCRGIPAMDTLHAAMTFSPDGAVYNLPSANTATMVGPARAFAIGCDNGCDKLISPNEHRRR